MGIGVEDWEIESMCYMGWVRKNFYYCDRMCIAYAATTEIQSSYSVDRTLLPVPLHAQTDKH